MIEFDGRKFPDADALYLHGFANGQMSQQGRIVQLEQLCRDLYHYARIKTVYAEVDFEDSMQTLGLLEE